MGASRRKFHRKPKQPGREEQMFDKLPSGNKATNKRLKSYAGIWVTTFD
jgi:hypothetical protein